MAERTDVMSFGRLEEDNSHVLWIIYIEKIDCYFLTNNIKDVEKAKYTLLSSVEI